MGVVFKLRVLGILSSLLVSGGGVSAADLPSFSFKRSAGWLASDWTGFYFGGHFGYATGYSLWNAPEPGMAIPALAGSLDFFKAFDGFKGTGSYYLGFHGGYSYMFPSRFHSTECGRNSDSANVCC